MKDNLITYKRKELYYPCCHTSLLSAMFKLRQNNGNIAVPERVQELKDLYYHYCLFQGKQLNLIQVFMHAAVLALVTRVSCVTVLRQATLAHLIGGRSCRAFSSRGLTNGLNIKDNCP